MICYVCWKWSQQGTSRQFGSEHVNVLGSMLRRHCGEHRLVCVTRETDGLDHRIDAIAPPVAFEWLKNPYGKEFPNCYRRLWNFSADAAREFGPRIVSLDIDCVVTNPLDPLFERDVDFIGWCDERFRWDKISGGIYYLRGGAHTEVWDDFDPEKSPEIARKAGCGGSDQAWMTHKLRPLKHKWGQYDGLAKVSWVRDPADVRIAFTSGATPPWSAKTQRNSPWVLEHWH